MPCPSQIRQTTISPSRLPPTISLKTLVCTSSNSPSTITTTQHQQYNVKKKTKKQLKYKLLNDTLEVHHLVGIRGGIHTDRITKIFKEC